jgi:hypothetical protein
MTLPPHGSRLCALRSALAAALVGASRISLAGGNAASDSFQIDSASASFRIDSNIVDSAGGMSSSASHVLTSCLGSQIAGSASSASFQLESGCGAALGFASVTPSAPLPTSGASPVPTLSVEAGMLLAVLVCAFGMQHLRRRLR